MSRQLALLMGGFLLDGGDLDTCAGNVAHVVGVLDQPRRPTGDKTNRQGVVRQLHTESVSS